MVSYFVRSIKNVNSIEFIDIIEDKNKYYDKYLFILY